jgi:hypothetical protein
MKRVAVPLAVVKEKCAVYVARSVGPQSIEESK